MVTHPPTPSLYGKKGSFKVPFLFERDCRRKWKAAGGRFALRKPEVLCHKGTDLGNGLR